MMTATQDQARALIERARSDTEACRQLAYWTQQLIAAHEARQQLLRIPAETVIAAMEQDR